MNGQQRLTFLKLLLFATVFAWLYPPRVTAAEVAKPTVDMSVYRHVVHTGWVVSELDRVVNYWQ